VPAASPKALRRSEECTRWLDRYTFAMRDTFRQKLAVEESCTSILADAATRKALQDQQPVVTLTYIRVDRHINRLDLSVNKQ
jgi:hypothetical protein